MQRRFGVAMAIAAGVFVVSSTAPRAQKAQEPAQAAGNHKHYEAPTDFQNKPGPNGELAPRLQKLGTHVFPVSTKSPRAKKVTSPASCTASRGGATRRSSRSSSR